MCSLQCLYIGRPQPGAVILSQGVAHRLPCLRPHPCMLQTCTQLLFMGSVWRTDHSTAALLSNWSVHVGADGPVGDPATCAHQWASCSIRTQCVQGVPAGSPKVKLAYSFSDAAYNRSSFTIVGVHTSQVLPWRALLLWFSFRISMKSDWRYFLFSSGTAATKRTN